MTLHLHSCERVDPAAEKAAFIAGYKKAKADAINQCLGARASTEVPDWKIYNMALHSAVLWIRTLDARRAVPK